VAPSQLPRPSPGGTEPPVTVTVTRDSGLGAGSARSLSHGHAVTVAPPGIVTARAALILQPAGGRARRPSQPVTVLDSAPKPSPRLMNVLVPHAPVDELY
jgi:hypothetical protein